MRSTLERAVFDRTELLMGERIMDAIGEKKVIIFGVGGVGSWCAEGLIRSGIRHLTIVDSDRICITNVNRQMMATTKTLGQVKVEALKARLLEINPKAEINAVQKIYSEEIHAEFGLDSYDYVVDAIDSLKDKISLLLRASESSATLFSSMGAAVKIDPTQVRVAEFWNVDGCPLASAIRKRMRHNKTLPAKEFLCVYDAEVLPNLGKWRGCICAKSGGAAEAAAHAEATDNQQLTTIASTTSTPPGNPALAGHEWCTAKARVNGTTGPITAIFGFTLSGLILQDIYKSFKEK